MATDTQLPSEERVAELRHLRNLLKTGEYMGTDIMLAWIALAEYADLLEARSAHEELRCEECERLVIIERGLMDPSRVVCTDCESKDIEDFDGFDFEDEGPYGHDPDLDENGVCRVCGKYEPE